MSRVRLEPCAWTREDEEVVLARIFRTGRWGQILRTLSLYGDARDAELMLLFTETRGQWMTIRDWQEMLKERGLSGGDTARISGLLA